MATVSKGYISIRRPRNRYRLMERDNLSTPIQRMEALDEQAEGSIASKNRSPQQKQNV